MAPQAKILAIFDVDATPSGRRIWSTPPIGVENLVYPPIGVENVVYPPIGVENLVAPP